MRDRSEPAEPLGPWPDGASLGPMGLVVSGVSARELAEEYGTPLIVVDEAHVRRRCREFRDAFGQALWAVKAFPIRALIRVALEEGLGLLAATGGEVDACLRAGAPGERIALHGNNKLDNEIEEAVRSRVGLVFVDSEEELYRLDRAAAAEAIRQPMLLRVVPGVDASTHAFVKTGTSDTKFGIPLVGRMAMDALEKARELATLDVRGLHLHVGSQLLEATPYLRAVDIALDFLVQAREQLGFTAELLDVGGGMGVRYADERPLGIRPLAEAILERVRLGCQSRGMEPPEILVEPGRAITSGAALTLYSIGSIKHVPGIRTYVAVDGGMSDNLRPALYGSRYTLALASRESGAGPRPVTVVGRHCESGDVLAHDAVLPGDLRRGDVLAVASTGAYEYAMSSNYNRVGRPAVVMLREGRAQLVARREDYGDLARLDVD